MDPESQPSPVAHNIALYAQIGLVMLVGVYVVWVVLCGIDAQIAMMTDPHLLEEIKAATGIDFSDSSTVPSLNAGADQFVTLLRIVSPKMHWFAVAVVTSVICFPPLGFLLGRSAQDPSWAGLLPVIGLASGMNPACISSPESGALFPLSYQLIVLVLQILLIQCVANVVYSCRRLVALRVAGKAAAEEAMVLATREMSASMRKLEALARDEKSAGAQADMAKHGADGSIDAPSSAPEQAGSGATDAEAEAGECPPGQSATADDSDGAGEQSARGDRD